MSFSIHCTHMCLFFIRYVTTLHTQFATINVSTRPFLHIWNQLWFISVKSSLRDFYLAAILIRVKRIFTVDKSFNFFLNLICLWPWSLISSYSFWYHPYKCPVSWTLKLQKTTIYCYILSQNWACEFSLLLVRYSW